MNSVQKTSVTNTFIKFNFAVCVACFVNPLTENTDRLSNYNTPSLAIHICVERNKTPLWFSTVFYFDKQFTASIVLIYLLSLYMHNDKTSFIDVRDNN